MLFTAYLQFGVLRFGFVFVVIFDSFCWQDVCFLFVFVVLLICFSGVRKFALLLVFGNFD